MVEPTNPYDVLLKELEESYAAFFADNAALDKAYREGTIKDYVSSVVSPEVEEETDEPGSIEAVVRHEDSGESSVVS